MRWLCPAGCTPLRLEGRVPCPRCTGYTHTPSPSRRLRAPRSLTTKEARL